MGPKLSAMYDKYRNTCNRSSFNSAPDPSIPFPIFDFV